MMTEIPHPMNPIVDVQFEISKEILRITGENVIGIPVLEVLETILEILKTVEKNEPSSQI